MHRPEPFITTILVLVFLLQNTVASAQESINLYLSEPILDSFPQVKVFLQVHDESGQPINDIPINAFSILEDNQAAVDVTIQEVEIGTRLVYAINTSPALRIRDSLGRSRFDLIRTALLAWFALPEHASLALDQYSLITSEGIQLETSSASADIASLLANLESPFDVGGDYELLFRALDVTNEPAPIIGMPSNIFFITPLLRPSLDIPLESIIARARASQTSIYPILVGPPDIVEQSEIESFELLAAETGGALTFFDPDQGLLELAQKMIDLRTQYQFTYRSLATTSGPHEINIKFSSDGIETESLPRSFILELLGPEITLLNLPTVIQRKSDDPSTALESIPPISQVVDFAVQFPDGYPRPIVQSQLLVDGEIIDQKLQAPFSPLNWDLRNVLNDGTTSVQVTVIDSLGFQSSSLLSEINLEVELPPRGLAAVRPALSSFLIALGVLLGGVALAALLLTMGRRTSSLPPDTPSKATVQATPITKIRQELPDEPIEAYLYPLPGDQDSPGTIYLTGTEISIGRDPNFAAVPLDDLSVEGLHARIIRQVDGSYILRDQGSKAGTWVQYQQIPSAGQKLSHGDIVHFGRSGYRFVFALPPPEKEIRITRASKMDGPTEGTTS